MKIDWQKPTIDATIAVAGGQLLDQFVVSKIQFLADLIAKLPADVFGISLKAVLLGAAALITAKQFMK